MLEQESSSTVKDAWLPLEVPALKKNKSQREPGMYFLNRARTSTCSSNPASWKQGCIRVWLERFGCWRGRLQAHGRLGSLPGMSCITVRTLNRHVRAARCPGLVRSSSNQCLMMFWRTLQLPEPFQLPGFPPVRTNRLGPTGVPECLSSAWQPGMGCVALPVTPSK